ncbi:MAG: TIGR01212 family radical SAM protein [Bacillota bacterium]|nr:TIGR01212 family radical SAM protein [Bacillota bacterium]
MTAPRWYAFSRFLRERFGRPIYKIPLDAGFTCPNRDGRIGRGGCTFCYNPSFAPAAGSGLTIREQIARGKAALRRRDPRAGFLAYFQSHTNTYAPPAALRGLFDSALADPEVVGLAVATRPDCAPDPVLDLLEEYTRKRHVWVEYGLQSIHDRTLHIINRGHSAADFIDAVRRTRGRNIFVCAHIILGLPGEDREDFLATARALTALGLDGVKIHHLQVIRRTPLAAAYARGEVRVLSLPEYVPLVCDFLEHLDPRMTIHRLFGEVLCDDLLLAPRWETDKAAIVAAIAAELERRGSRQGAHVKPS